MVLKLLILLSRARSETSTSDSTDSVPIVRAPAVPARVGGDVEGGAAAAAAANAERGGEPGGLSGGCDMPAAAGGVGSIKVRLIRLVLVCLGYGTRACVVLSGPAGFPLRHTVRSLPTDGRCPPYRRRVWSFVD